MKPHGFTLFELVIAMVILAILAVFSVRFIQDAVAIYQQGSQRERLMSDVRFGLERLNREVRDAVPGSLRVEQPDGTESGSGPCVRFWPIAMVSRYESLNVNSETGITDITLTAPDTLTLAQGNRVVVFPLDFDSRAGQCTGGNACVAIIQDDPIPAVDADGNITLKLQTAEGGAPYFMTSETQRVYIARQQVRYCLNSEQLNREMVALDDADFSSGMAEAVLMAEHISQGSFAVDKSGLYQQLRFNVTASQNNENLEFSHVIRLYNAP
ncbi:PulJ/GspJ family protein [Zobellella taiwanensis]